MNKTLLIVDGHNLAHRCFHQPNLKQLRRADGKKSGVFYGFLTGIHKLLIKFKPNKCIVIFDSKTGSDNKRKANVEYKHKRTGKGKKVLYRQIRDLEKILKKLGVTVVSHPDVEADDVIWNLAMVAQPKNKVIIVTADHDLFQAITPKCFVYDDQRQTMWTEKTVKAKYGLPPSKIALWKALAGDKSDSVSGVRGIGPKQATILANRFKTFDKLLLSFPPKRQKELIIAWGSVQLAPTAELRNFSATLLTQSNKVKKKKAKKLLKKYSCNSILNKFPEWCKQFK